MKDRQNLNIKLTFPNDRDQILEVVIGIKKMLDKGYTLDDIIKYDDFEDYRPRQIKIMFSKEKEDER
jgi:hypothetical protein|uniref:Uncharacterized protein n=1 Tax=Myoviridae sp. ctkfK18 TaxID=2825165 RepID=A0A8S5VGT0_9CAUD|nr:MAG TPA: hypothetical protein [Myoviridae sp. ctkfK18]